MRTRFTFVALTLAAAIGTSFTIVSCSPDATDPVQSVVERATAAGQSAQPSGDQTAWMGRYHNDALTFALGRIKASKRLSNFERCKVGLAALVDFQKAYRRAGGSTAFDDISLTKGMCEEAVAAASGASAARSVMLNGMRPRSDISLAANTYMNQILNQIDYATSTLSLSSAVNKIVSQAGAALVPLEAAAVSGTGSIAVSSSSYWETNESAWLPQQTAYSRSAASESSLETLPGAPVSVSSRTRGIIRADVMAAIGVLASEWFMGEVSWAHAAIKAAAASLVAGIFYTT